MVFVARRRVHEGVALSRGAVLCGALWSRCGGRVETPGPDDGEAAESRPLDGEAAEGRQMRQYSMMLLWRRIGLQLLMHVCVPAKGSR